MAIFFDSLLDFFKGVLGRCYFWLFALLLDPFDFYNRFKPDEWPRYDVSLGAFFIVLGLLVIWTAFLTYHDLNRKTYWFNPEPDMPLHKACRWIARDSVWAAKYPSEKDNDWVTRVDDELMSKVMQGRLELFGCPKIRATQFGPLQHLTADFKGSAQWDSSNLVSDNPPFHMWRPQSEGGDLYTRIKLDSRQVKRNWPRRSFWSKLLKNSPIERIGGYSEIFNRQDANYQEKYFE